jgi:hypothetical protein
MPSASVIYNAHTNKQYQNDIIVEHLGKLFCVSAHLILRAEEYATVKGMAGGSQRSMG